VVAEELDPLRSEALRRLGGLGGPAHGQRHLRPDQRRAEPLLAGGGQHEDDPPAGRGQARHRAAGEDRLVVGMGVEEDDSPRRFGTHPPCLAQPSMRY
jgi:hypothetical protein